MATYLGDPRQVVAQQAIERLGQQGDAAITLLRDLLKTSQNLQQRLNSVWTLTRIDAPAARAAVRSALSDSDETVRQAALHSISLRRDADAEHALVTMLGNSSPSNRRAAAEALGRLGSAETIDALLAAVDETTLQDRALEHSLIYALIEIGNPAQTRLALASKDPLVQRAALIALDQMRDGKLQSADVVGLLESPEVPLRETAWWIAEKHPEWAGELAVVFEKAVRRQQSVPEDLTALSGRLERFVKDPGVQAVMADALTEDSVQPDVQVAVLNAMIFSGLKSMPAAWSAPLQKHLSTTDPTLLEKSVKAVSTLSNGKPSSAMAKQLRGIVGDTTLPAQIRLQALVALPAADRSLDRDLLAFLCEHLDIEQGISLRSLATDILLSTPLSSEQLQTVADATATTGPMELKRLMEVFTKSGDPEVGARLVNALENSASVSSLSPDELRKQFAVFRGNVLTNSLPLLARIERENQQKYQKLESVLSKLDQGDIRRGQKVFHSSKVSCIACHAMGYLGGRVGPDLTRIGGIRSERDLLESVLFPSASFVRSFEPTAIATVDGKVHSGIIIGESSTELVLQMDAEKTLHIPVGDIGRTR